MICYSPQWQMDLLSPNIDPNGTCKRTCWFVSVVSQIGYHRWRDRKDLAWVLSHQSKTQRPALVKLHLCLCARGAQSLPSHPYLHLVVLPWFVFANVQPKKNVLPESLAFLPSGTPISFLSRLLIKLAGTLISSPPICCSSEASLARTNKAQANIIRLCPNRDNDHAQE